MNEPVEAHDVEEPPPLRPRRKGIYILPNLFTLAALFAGFYAIVQAMNLNFDLASIAIFVAMVLCPRPSMVRSRRMRVSLVLRSICARRGDMAVIRGRRCRGL